MPDHAHSQGAVRVIDLRGASVRSGCKNRGMSYCPLMNGENKSWFGCFAKKASCYAGRPATFGVAIAGIVIWAACGPFLDFSDTWQLMVNTSTTIVTFLMVFLI